MNSDLEIYEATPRDPFTVLQKTWVHTQRTLDSDSRIMWCDQ